MGRMKLSCSLLGKVMINMINGSMQWTWVILQQHCLQGSEQDGWYGMMDMFGFGYDVTWLVLVPALDPKDRFLNPVTWLNSTTTWLIWVMPGQVI